jgi:hypothetical protein
MNRVGIFIVSWNRLLLVMRTLDSLFECLDVAATVTVIDNASERSVRCLLQQDTRIRLHQLDTNRWVNGAHEAAWPHDLTSRFDLVLCSDNDVEFREPISTACLFLQENPQHSVVSLQHSPEHPARRETTWRGRPVIEKRYERGTAVLCRASFLQANRPLPTHRRLDFDWWLFRDGPDSVERRGECVPVLAGAARHLGWRRGLSTWQDIEIQEYAQFKE